MRAQAKRASATNRDGSAFGRGRAYPGFVALAMVTIALLVLAPLATAQPIVGPIAGADTEVNGGTVYGYVVPNGEATSYRFRWGTTASYGNQTPLAAAGSGTTKVFASAPIGGLQPSTTYHFRLMATNGSGTVEGEDHQFTTEAEVSTACPNQQFRQGAAANLLDCRAYEQVSPVDKNGNDIAGADDVDGPAVSMPVSVSGDTALFNSRGSFADNPGGGPALGPFNQYVSRRSGGQWKTLTLPGRSTVPSDRSVILNSSDLSSFLLRAVGHSFEPDPLPPPPLNGFYFRNPFKGEITKLFDAPENAVSYYAGTPDLSHIAFISSSDFLEDPSIPDTGVKTWELDLSQGQFRLVGRQPGTDAPLASAAIAGLSNGGNAWGANAISSDGNRIFFETPGTLGGPSGNSALIYRRSNGTTTELASPSKRTPADPLGPRQKQFRMATPDGNRVFFTSPELLTDDANTGASREGSDLYRYDIASDQLVDISAVAGGSGARVQNLVGTSDDGNRVYYVALGQVVAGQGTAGQPNLYLWEDDGTTKGSTRFIATLDSTDNFVWTTSNSKRSEVTSDGRYLLLMSKASLTGYPNAGTTQIYRYDADASAGLGELACISCNPSGNPPAGSATWPGGGLRKRVISEDGRYAFFTSEDALLVGDTNGKPDVYEWSNGQIGLLSSGTNPSQSRFFSTSADGRQAFFATREQLVPQDNDSNVDLYVAAVNGGLVAQFATTPPSCAGEECRAGGSQPPADQVPLSAGFSGPGNTRPHKPVRCGKGKRKVRSRNGKTRCVKRNGSRRSRGRANHNRRIGR